VALYVVTDGHKNYIRRDVNGKYVIARSRALADEYIEKWKAEKILRNNITPKKRKKFYVKEEDVGIANVATEKDTDNVDGDKTYHSQVDTIYKKVEDIKNFIHGFENRKNELSSFLSRIDKEIIDIQHYIEFTDIEDDDALSTYKMLKQRLKLRRQVKNELSIIGHMRECKMEGSMIDSLSEMILNIDKKTYVPRIMTNLF